MSVSKGLLDELARFVYFNAGVNTVATVRIEDKDSAYFWTNFTMAAGLILINQRIEVPILLQRDSANQTVIGITARTHMLEGARRWSVDVEQGANCDFNVQVKTEAYERKVGYLNHFGAYLVGNEMQSKVREQYRLNIANGAGNGLFILKEVDPTMPVPVFPPDFLK